MQRRLSCITFPSQPRPTPQGSRGATSAKSQVPNQQERRRARWQSMQQRNKFNETAHRTVQLLLQDFTQAHLTCGAGMASLLRTIRYEEPRRVLHLVNHNEGTTGNNGVCGLAELGISYARNVADGIEHWTQEEEDAEERPTPFSSNRGDVPAGSTSASDNVTYLLGSKCGNATDLSSVRGGWTMESFLRWKNSERDECRATMLSYSCLGGLLDQQHRHHHRRCQLLLTMFCPFLQSRIIRS